MAFLAKLAASRLPGSQVALVRFAIGIVPILLVPAWRRAALQYQRLDLLFYRGFFGAVAVLFYFVAIEHIPVGVATLLNYTSPMFAGVFAAIFIREPIRGRIALPMVIAFAGVFFVVRSHASPEEVVGFGRWELFALLSAMLSGAAVTAIRGARRTESSWSVFGSFTLFGVLATAPFGIAQWRPPDLRGWSLLLLIGVVSIAAQMLMTHAYRWVETLTAGVMSQLAVIVAMALGGLLLGEAITRLSIIGTALTIGGVIAVIVATAPPQEKAAEALTPPE